MAVYPQNDPDIVRQLLRALRVRGQEVLQTPWGAREAWRDWLKSERRLSGHTLIAYEHDVDSFLGFMAGYLGAAPTLPNLGKLKPAEFRAWLAERAHQGLARTSTARAFSSVRSFFNFLDKRGMVHNASRSDPDPAEVMPTFLPFKSFTSSGDFASTINCQPKLPIAALATIRDITPFLRPADTSEGGSRMMSAAPAAMPSNVSAPLR